MGASGEVQLTGKSVGCALRTCTYEGLVVPDETLRFTFPVDVAAHPPATCQVPAGAVSCVTDVVRVSGGGASSASVSTSTVISTQPAGFGIASGGATTALSSTRAGAHPDITNTIAFNTVDVGGSLAGGDFKNVTYRLPPGFASDFLDTPVCPPADFLGEECPTATQIGITTAILTGGFFTVPVYNVAPGPGEIAKLGFRPVGALIVNGSITLRPGDYGANVSFQDINQSLEEVDNVSLTVWGVPASPIHDPLRFENQAGSVAGTNFGHPSEAAPAPFFTNPTLCGSESLESEFSVTSWQQPNESESPPPTKMSFGPITGCDRLGMEPSLTAEATTSDAYAPTGLDLNTSVPQTYENPEGLATSTLKRAVVTLPEGMTVNPSAGAGLQDCSEAEYEAEALQFVEGQGCPSESKLGTVKIVTPVLKEEASGSVFLAEPAPLGEAGRNPFGSLLALYIVARIPERGILIKAAGEVQANSVTGQLVTTFDTTNVAAPHAGLPPLPFSLLTFRFNQGATSPLVTPPTCGDYEVKAALTSWSDPDGVPLTPLIPPFPIDSDCPSGGVPPFAPQAIAGTDDDSAGSYSPLYLRIVRNDGEQEITGFASQLPPGLTANLTGVPFCSEAAIEAARQKTGVEEEANPSCPVASEIGHTVAEAGVGAVLAQAPGKIYMAGPFDGAPFSVAAITSAHVGPFDLGTVVVHLPLNINPETGAVSIPAGAADQIPHIIKGIVVHIRDIRVYINRPSFTLNPTNCDPMSFSATVIGGGADPTNPADNDPVTVTNPFQAADCSSLKFAPKFSVSTSAKTSSLDGASLHVDLAYPSGSLGQDANIKEVKVDLPKQLPSRLTDAAESLHRGAVHREPRGVPRGIKRSAPRPRLHRSCRSRWRAQRTSSQTAPRNGPN